MITWTQIQRRRGDLSNSIRLNALKVEQLTHMDQFFLFLCFVRQGFREQDLAVRYQVSQSTISRILITWANFLYFVFGTVPIWASKNRLSNPCQNVLSCSQIPE